MFTTKREVDTHVRDLLAKVHNDTERIQKCFTIGKLYASIKEFESAKRHLETFLRGNPNSGEGLRLLGDIHWELSEEEKALQSYKESYKQIPNRETLNRICDLLAQGSGPSESQESRQRWFDLQKTPGMDTPLNGSSYSNGRISFNMSDTPGYNNGGGGRAFLSTLVSRSFVPSTGVGTMSTPGKSPINIMNGNGGSAGRIQPNFQPTYNSRMANSPQASLKTPKQRVGMGTSCPQPSPERMMLQMNYLEKKCDDVMDRIADQNTQLLSAINNIKISLSGEIREIHSKVGNVTSQLQSLSLTGNISEEIAALHGDVRKARQEIHDLQAITATSLAAAAAAKEAKPKTKSPNNPKPQPSTIPAVVPTVPPPAVVSAPPPTILAPPLFSFGMSNISSPTPANSTPIYPKIETKTPEFKGFGGLAESKLPLFDSFKTPPSMKLDEKDTPDAVDSPLKKVDEPPKLQAFEKFSFSSSPGFGDLAAAGSTQAFSKPIDFKGFGSGGALFGNMGSTTPTKSPAVEPIKPRRISEGEDAEGFVCTAEFTPVIELPPLVEVKLGDENETAVFEHRAKIYRFDSSVKEWKERGVGNIKILQDNDKPNSVRVVMWREKVGKLACNHRLTGDMKIDFYQNQKVVRWTAVDHAEQEARPEIFTCKFGQEEMCAAFKKKFEEMVDLVASTSPSSTPTRAEPVVADQRPLSELFKKPEGSWDCDGCYSNNPPNTDKCLSCTTPRPGSIVKSEPAVVAPDTPAFSFGFNLPSQTVTDAKTPEFKGFGNNMFGADSFKTPPSLKVGGGEQTPKAGDSTSTPQKSDAPIKVNPFENFSFSSSPGFGDLAATGSTQAFSKPIDFKGFGSGGALFGNMGSTTLTNSPAADPAKPRRVSEGEDAEGFVCTAEFTPVIELPPLVEVKLGDENETAVFEHRAKIYRFDSSVKEWKERGVGNIKILQDNDKPSSVRVVMWREKVGKLACNHRLTGDMKIDFYQSQKVVRWTAVDHAEQEPRPEIFTCKFGEENMCAEFKRKFEEMVDLVSNTSPSSSPAKPTDAASVSAVADQRPLSEVYKKPEGSWDCDGCYCNNPSNANKCLSCSTPKPGSVADSEPAIVAPETPAFSFGFNLPSQTVTESKTPEFKGFGSSTMFGGDSFKTPPSLKVGAGDNNVNTGDSTSTPQKTDDPLKLNPFEKFSLTAGGGFGDLAAAGSTQAFSKPVDFKGFGAGQPLFGNLTPSTPAEKDREGKERARTTSEGEDAEGFVCTAEFTPVIELPPLVEVKLGDENETAVFEHRAKIYRFDSSVKEWKERGVGNIKILQDNDNPNSVRVVMWREKVGKLACNHRLTGDMKIEFYQSQKVVRWTAVDHAEQEARPEIFTCKFGQEDMCAEFKRKFEEMVDLVSNTSPSSSLKPSGQDAASVVVDQRPLSEVFKKPEGSWECEGCYTNNSPNADKCLSCTTPRPGSVVKSESAVVAPGPEAPAFSFGFNLTSQIVTDAKTPEFKGFGNTMFGADSFKTPPSLKLGPSGDSSSSTTSFRTPPESLPLEWAEFDSANFA